MKNNLMQSIKNTNDMIKFLSGLGYKESPAHGGSHTIYKCTGRAPISLPAHNGRKSPLSEGTKRNIIKLACGQSYYQH